MAAAHGRGLQVSLDVNYRRSLWSLSAAGAALLPLMSQVDVLLGLGSDAAAVFGLELADDEPAVDLDNNPVRLT